jgi:hypothetical protein
MVGVTGGAELAALWATRSLAPADLSGALAVAAQDEGVRVVFTHWRAVAAGQVLPSSSVRIVTSHPPGDAPPRRPVSRHHCHLAPDADAAAASAVVLRLLTTEEPAVQT